MLSKRGSCCNGRASKRRKMCNMCRKAHEPPTSKTSPTQPNNQQNITQEYHYHLRVGCNGFLDSAATCEGPQLTPFVREKLATPQGLKVSYDGSYKSLLKVERIPNDASGIVMYCGATDLVDHALLRATIVMVVSAADC